jgi:hypothetical protein
LRELIAGVNKGGEKEIENNSQDKIACHALSLSNGRALPTGLSHITRTAGCSVVSIRDSRIGIGRRVRCVL